jgi:hypothetical protein
MSNHDLITFLLGSLSGFSLTFFIFACWYSKQEQAIKNTHESQLADAKRIAWAGGYESASRNHVNNLNVAKQ